MKLKALALGVAALCGLGVGCGDDDDGGDATAAQETPPIVSFTTTEQGNRVELKLSGTPRAGANLVRYHNEGEAEHEAQLLRVDGEHSQSEVMAALRSASSGKVIPDWLHAVGGANSVPGGNSSRAEVALEAGTYYAADLNGPEEGNDNKPYFEQGALTSFKVTGGAGSAELPPTRAKVTADEYSFTATGLRAGKNRIRFANVGREVHHVIAVPMQPGKSLAEVREFIKAEKGEPPIDFGQAVGTSAIDGGSSENVELELKRGKYALLCFISDRDGGPPHVVQGMVGEAEVQ